MRGICQKDFRPITRALSVQKKVSENMVLCIKHNFQLKLVYSIYSIALLSQGTVLQLTTDHQRICAQVHTQCHKSYVRIIRQVRVICTSKGMQKSLGCALQVGKYSNILLFTLRHVFWITYLRCISTSFFNESGNPLFKKFCRASTVAASTFDFRATLDCTNNGASFTTSERIQQHINCNLERRRKKSSQTISVGTHTKSDKQYSQNLTYKVNFKQFHMVQLLITILVLHIETQ